jgi:hypothetical protein
VWELWGRGYDWSVERGEEVDEWCEGGRGVERGDRGSVQCGYDWDVDEDAGVKNGVIRVGGWNWRTVSKKMIINFAYVGKFISVQYRKKYEIG